MSFEAASLMRNGLAVIAGLGVGSAVNMALITLNTSVLFPMPPGVSFDDEKGFGDYIQSLPFAAYGIVFVAHYGQAIVGGYLAARFAASPTSSPICCYIVGGLTMLGSIVNTISLPVPKWTWIEIPFFPLLIVYTAKLAAEHGAAASGGKSK